MKTVSVQVLSAPTVAGAYLLFPRPYNDWVEVCTSVDASNVGECTQIHAENSGQTAFLAETINGNAELPLIRYEFSSCRQSKPELWFWQIQSNRYTTASVELLEHARCLCEGKESTQLKIRALIDQAAEIFGYGHQDQRFNEGHDEVPHLCGTAKGSCVDINTYLIAAARSLDIPVQYIAGYWFHSDKTETLDMHCWLVFMADGEPLFWDLAHHLKWDVPELNPGLNPAGGRRVPMSYGRGLIFETPNGTVQISHFSEPVWVLPDGSLEEPEVRISIEEDEGPPKKNQT